MNHKVKIGLEIGGALVGAYVLYKLYANYQANQQAANNAALNSMSFLPPLQMGGYAPAQTSGGTDSGTSNSQLNDLLSSILNPSSSTSNPTTVPPLAPGQTTPSGTNNAPAFVGPNATPIIGTIGGGDRRIIPIGGSLTPLSTDGNTVTQT